MAPLVYVLVLLYQTVSTDAECTVNGCNSTFCEGDKCTECVKPYYLTLVGSCGHCYLQCRLCDSNICFSCPPPTVSGCDYACEIADCPISCTGPGNSCPDCPDGFFKYNPSRQECFRCYYSGCKCSTFQECIDCLPGRYDTTSNCKHTCPSECITCTNTSNCTECIPGKYGPACASDCKSQCQDGNCDKDSGVCPSGCLADQFLDSNQKCKACPDRCGSCTNYSYCISCSSPQYWGPVCERDCAGCINNCSKDIGCLSECSTKYYREFNKDLNGYICSRCPESCRSCNNTSRCSVCETGYWGNTCQHNCSGCKASCNINDGCSSGCLSGYYERVINGSIQCEKCPDNCVSCSDNATCKECISGYYSPDAANCIICSDKCLGGNCITHIGICTNGCVNGWTGHQCNQECPTGCLLCEQLTAAHCSLCKIGFYGNSCENICSVHCNLNDGNQTCNQIDGACINGCLSGYWGRNCNRPCGPGCYGTQCNETTGACYSGCKDNFSGNHCNKECISVQDVKTDLHSRDETDETCTNNTTVVILSIVAGVAVVMAAISFTGNVILFRRGRTNSKAASPSSATEDQELDTNTYQDLYRIETSEEAQASDAYEKI